MSLRLVLGGDVMLGRLAGETMLREGAGGRRTARCADRHGGLLRPPGRFRRHGQAPGMAWLALHDEAAAIDVGWKIVYGHSAHVFQGVELYEGCPILYAAGDLVDDYAVDPVFRNDHQLLFELELGEDALERIVMHPLFIRRCRVFPANSAQRGWIGEHMQALCRELDAALHTDGTTMAIVPGAQSLHE